MNNIASKIEQKGLEAIKNKRRNKNICRKTAKKSKTRKL